MSQHLPGSMPGWSRPIRVPEEIHITHAEPPYAIAGETSTWRLPFRLSKGVPSGSVLELEIAGGRNNKGVFHSRAVTAEFADGAPLEATPSGKGGSYLLAVPATGLAKGVTVTVTLWDCEAPDVRQLNKFFVLHTVPTEGEEREFPQWAGGAVWAEGTSDRMVAVCTMHVLGGRLHHLRAYAPSAALPWERLSVLVRPEDELDNLSHERPGNLSVFLGNEELPAEVENVFGSTCVRVRLTLQERDIHRLRVLSTDSGLEATTNPIACGPGTQVLWGMIHGHTEMSDGTGTLEQYFHQLKNEVALDFAAPGDHDHLWETSGAFWQTTCEAVKRWHCPGEFVTFLGYEWAKWRRNGDGDRNVYYLADDRPLYRSDDGEHPSPPDLFEALTQNREQAIVIPHHTGHGGNFCDWKDHDNAYERLVEIFQIRGSFECTEQDGSPAPECNSRVPAFEAGYVRNALALGWRVGFTAGGDDHVGHWGSEACVGAYKQGLMCVEAPERTREAIFAAMVNRRVVATTGPRMLLTYRLNGHPMGAELSVSAIPELATCRALTIEFHGTAPVDRVDVVRNNTVVCSASRPSGSDACITWEDDEPLDAIWLPAAKFCNHPFAFYYVRVIQQDGEAAWASPIWVDP